MIELLYLSSIYMKKQNPIQADILWTCEQLWWSLCESIFNEMRIQNSSTFANTLVYLVSINNILMIYLFILNKYTLPKNYHLKKLKFMCPHPNMWVRKSVAMRVNLNINYCQSVQPAPPSNYTYQLFYRPSYTRKKIIDQFTFDITFIFSWQKLWLYNFLIIYNTHASPHL